MPAHVHDGAHSARVVDHHGRIVFHRIAMHRIRKKAGSAVGLTEQTIRHIDTVRGDVVERSASRFRWVDQPTAMASLFIAPFVASEFGEHGLADRSGLEQLFGTLHLGVSPAIVGHAEGAPGFFRSLYHQSRLGLVHGHGLLAQHVLAGAKRLNGLGRVKEDWSRDVNGLHFGIAESFAEGRPHLRVARRSFCRIARDQAIQAASGRGLNRGNDATGGDVSDSDYDPVQHSRTKFEAYRNSKAGLSRPLDSIYTHIYFLAVIASLAAFATRNFTT